MNMSDYGSFGGRLFETAEAAAAGGTTTIVDFAPQEKDVPLLDAIRRQAAKAEHTSSVDFAFHAVIMDQRNLYLRKSGICRRWAWPH